MEVGAPSLLTYILVSTFCVIGGYTCAWIRWLEFKEWSAGFRASVSKGIQPSLVIVYFGGNDSMLPDPLGLSLHVPLPEYVENMRKIATHLKSLSQKTRLIFLTAPPVNEEQMRKAFSGIMRENSRTNKQLQMYSDACVELCREMDIKAVDLFTSMQKRSDWSTVCFTDGIHFSSEGSKIVVEEILKVLEEADWERLQWNSLPTEFEEFAPYTASRV
ncbi:GDSL esterase/lipase CPRD49 isoform X3 [Rosa chinensis]|uniref:GDSL esterase/lipase CPRD49 isoform X3 n=1 Tax=Rosa chinensis TaxID=74649 RepID=UPI001AD8E0D4|nr:GDSL esterase/lipase CPRD49 isoform X3 [Rosa chinensis]